MFIGVGLFLILVSITGFASFSGAWWLLLIGCSLVGAWLNTARERL
ncbi:hypothetical protein B0I12_002539 [Microbacterium hydrothermale]|nr:hypothetical protein [Microbacterium hydrothermale]